MDYAKRLISTIEHLISTKNKKHIVGGILLSASIFLGGLAVTVISTKTEDTDEDSKGDKNEY